MSTDTDTNSLLSSQMTNEKTPLQRLDELEARLEALIGGGENLNDRIANLERWAQSLPLPAHAAIGLPETK